MGLLRVHTTSSRKERKKPKIKTKVQLEAEASFVKFKAKWDAVPKFAHSPPPKTAPKRKPSLEDMIGLAGQEQVAGKLDSGSTAPRSSQKYTGTEMLGTAQMAKSNEVPVFSKQDIIDIATMRRS